MVKLRALGYRAICFSLNLISLGTDTAFPLYDDTAPTEGVAVPLGVMLVAWGTAGERLYFLHPFVPVAAPRKLFAPSIVMQPCA